MHCVHRPKDMVISCFRNRMPAQCASFILLWTNVISGHNACSLILRRSCSFPNNLFQILQKKLILYSYILIDIIRRVSRFHGCNLCLQDDCPWLHSTEITRLSYKIPYWHCIGSEVWADCKLERRDGRGAHKVCVWRRPGVNNVN